MEPVVDTVSQLRRDEEVVYTLYKDSRGIWSFGTGFTFPIDDEENDFILNHRLGKVRAQLSTYSWYQSQDGARQGVLENMAYNLGVNGLIQFKKMLACAEAKDYEGWAREMQDSDWWNQVGARAPRLQKQVLTGEWQ